MSISREEAKARLEHMAKLCRHQGEHSTSTGNGRRALRDADALDVAVEVLNNQRSEAA